MNWDMISACSDVAGVVAVVVSLLYLSRQVRMSNQLARAEASRSPTSDLNMLNASFGVNPSFQSALCRGIEGVERPGFQPDERVHLDLYFVSVTNIYEQLVREVRQGILDEKALDFDGK